MDFKYRNSGVIKNSKRIYDDPDLHSRLIRSMEGTRFEEFIRAERKPCTTAQRAFYVGVILKEAHRHEQFIHYNQPIDIHKKVLAPMFLADFDAAGEEKVKELGDLSEQEMWDLTERVIAYLLTEFGIEIADKKHYHIK